MSHSGAVFLLMVLINSDYPISLNIVSFLILITQRACSYKHTDVSGLVVINSGVKEGRIEQRWL